MRPSSRLISNLIPNLMPGQAMRCWIAVYLPLLPLQSLRPRWCEPLPLAIMDGGQVLAMSRLAAAQGVRHGMRANGVQAIAPEVILQERDPQRERDALDAVALALLQYTPELAVANCSADTARTARASRTSRAPLGGSTTNVTNATNAASAAGDDATLLMDVTASLTAFRGRRALCRRVRDSVHALGFSLRLAMAPTAQGAWLLAHRRRADAHSLHRSRVAKLASLQRELDRTHFRWLPAAQPHADWLNGIGCQTLGDLRRLPRAGLQRRTDARLIEQLDRAYGEAPELYEWLQAPEQFAAFIELPYRVEQAALLLAGAQRLLLQMAGWLVARQQAVARLLFSLEHERGRTRRAPTMLEIALAEPAWQEAHLLRLVKERFARLPLPAPVMALRLEARDLSPWAPPNEQLFPEPGGTPEDYHRLLELLVSRLGAEAVQLAAPRADHRPEAANRWQVVERVDRVERASGRPHVHEKRHDKGYDKANGKGYETAHDKAPDEAVAAARPFWLLEQPLPLTLRAHRPFYGSPLRLLSGPERIESGWWDGALALRDYFIAQGDEGACYWIYRERDAGSARWFLHGLFA